jgi:hypothetical protein
MGRSIKNGDLTMENCDLTGFNTLEKGEHLEVSIKW